MKNYFKIIRIISIDDRNLVVVQRARMGPVLRCFNFKEFPKTRRLEADVDNLRSRGHLSRTPVAMPIHGGRPVK